MANTTTVANSCEPCRIPSAKKLPKEQLPSYRREIRQFESRQQRYAKVTLENKAIHAQPIEKRIYTTPRCTLENHLLFPLRERNFQDQEQQWKWISEQAGNHRQDRSVLAI